MRQKKKNKENREMRIQMLDLSKAEIRHEKEKREMNTAEAKKRRNNWP